MRANDAELPPIISIAQYPGHPVISVSDFSARGGGGETEGVIRGILHFLEWGGGVGRGCDEAEISEEKRLFTE